MNRDDLDEAELGWRASNCLIAEEISASYDTVAERARSIALGLYSYMLITVRPLPPEWEPSWLHDVRQQGG